MNDAIHHMPAPSIINHWPFQGPAVPSWTHILTSKKNPQLWISVAQLSKSGRKHVTLVKEMSKLRSPHTS